MESWNHGNKLNVTIGSIYTPITIYFFYFFCFSCFSLYSSGVCRFCSPYNIQQNVNNGLETYIQYYSTYTGVCMYRINLFHKLPVNWEFIFCARSDDKMITTAEVE